MTDLAVTHQPEQHCFVCDISGEQARITYRLNGTIIDFDHTFVPPAGRGKGIAALLTDAAVAWAREQGYQITASCDYVHKYLRLSR